MTLSDHKLTTDELNRYLAGEMAETEIKDILIRHEPCTTFLQPGDIWQIGDRCGRLNYQFEVCADGHFTDINPGDQVTSEQMYYLPRRRRLGLHDADRVGIHGHQRQLEHWRQLSVIQCSPRAACRAESDQRRKSSCNAIRYNQAPADRHPV